MEGRIYFHLNNSLVLLKENVCLFIKTTICKYKLNQTQVKIFMSRLNTGDPLKTQELGVPTPTQPKIHVTPT